MQKMILDPSLRSQFNGLTEQMEVCDENGKTIGQFLPEKLYQKLIYTAAEAACPYSKEQLAEFQGAAEGRSLAEFWQSLGQA